MSTASDQLIDAFKKIKIRLFLKRICDIDLQS